MQAYTEVCEPTAVNAAISLNFVSAEEQNLVVAKTSLLQIFRFAQFENEIDDADKDRQDNADADRRVVEGADHEEAFGGADVMLQRTNIETTTKFVLVAEYTLSGSITSLAKVKTTTSKSGGDCLLISFESAKLSLVEWDPSTFNIATISLHYYERDEFKSPIMPDYSPSFLISDPASRCAALKFNKDMLAILPFRQKEDEDLVLSDDDADVDGDKDTVMTDEPLATNGTAEAKETPYYPSFVVAASQLDEAIENIIDITFLHEYREPTLAVLYETKRSWTGLLEVRKDTLSFIIITLDLDQRASTPILSVAKLPYDIYRAISLPPPIGGTLLLGCNEVIHVDQAAKTTAVAVNQFAKQSSGYPMTDQSHLGLKLENAVVEPLPGEDGDLLLVTDHGLLVVISFKREGRNVSALTLTKCQKKDGSNFIGSACTAMASVGDRRLFLGSMSTDSVILGWRHRGERVGPSEKSEVVFSTEDSVDYENDDLDDLYGDSSPSGDSSKKQTTESGKGTGKATGEYIFRIHDRLGNIGPCRDVTFGKPYLNNEKGKTSFDVVTELDVVTTTGEGRDGGVSILRRKIVPDVIGRFEYKDCLGLWTVRARKKETKGVMASIAGGEEEINIGEQYDRYLFASKADESLVFNVGTQFDEIKGTEFDTSGATTNVGSVMDGQRIVQACETDMRVYDSDLQLSQIIPMFDEETGAEPAIVSATFSDPYVLVRRDDGTIAVYVCHESSLEVEEIAKPEAIKTSKYIAVNLFTARKGELLVNGEQKPCCHCLLLDENGSLQMYTLPDLENPTFCCDNFSTIPPHLNRETFPSRQHLKEDITEILMAYLGDESSSYPYLVVRTSQDDIVIYQPYIDPSQTPQALYFKKIPNYTLASSTGDVDKSLSRSMVVLDDVGGYSCVFMPGINPCFIMRSSKGYPRQYSLSGSSVRSLSPFHATHTERGFLYVDNDGIVRVCHLPDFSFEHSWQSKKIVLTETALALAYHAPLSVYVVCTEKRKPLEIGPEDDVPNSWQNIQSENGFEGILMPEVPMGSLKLISPLTWSVVDSYEFGQNEVGLVVKSVELEVSEESKARKQLIAVGTAVMRGEEMSARGGIYVFEIIEVVPEPGKPETNRKLKLIVREDVKGTVSALCGIEGYLLAAQGQKVMVRGLKEDQSLLPVAFMDMNMYVSVAKNLNGMILFGDIMKSIWFVGFSEEPYKMTLFGKDIQKLEVAAADFLPDDEQLFFVVADADSNLHIMQYDPEHPKSLAGQRLIRRADMFTGHEVRSVTMLPRVNTSKSTPSEDGETEQDQFLCLVTTLTGAMGIVVNLPELTYRRLNILQGQLTNGEEHFCGLNPRAYRACKYKSTSMEVLRSVLDAGFIKKWLNLSKGRRADLAARAGSNEGVIRNDLWEIQQALAF